MAFTPAEESRLRVLLGNDNALNTLAQNEPAIIQELGAQDVTIEELQIAASIIDSDKLLGRFGGEDKAATVTAIRAAILGAFLGQLKYGCPLIGMLVDWPLQQMPQEIWPDCKMEFIPYIAQAFDGVKFPLLKKLHPSGVLPADMRGQFVRGWDNGRGLDSGRQLMSSQLATSIGRNVGTDGATPTSSYIDIIDGENPTHNPSFTKLAVTNSTTQGSSYLKVKPTNICWNLIVRAA